MPNTLAHLGAQALLTRAVLRSADLKWVYLGCVIPDLTWILQRGVKTLPLAIDAYDLRLYSIVQASLFVSLLLGGAFSLLAKRPGRIFVILALGSLLHLLLDALEIKWANGVHLLAPLDWRLLNVGLFWPESLPAFLLTGFGLGYVVVRWREATTRSPELVLRPLRCLAAALLLVLYFALPLALLAGPERADNHFVRTLRQRALRSGKPLELHAADYLRSSSGARVVQTMTGEELEVEGLELESSAVVSVRAHFLSEDRIRVLAHHRHWKRLRDASSYLGLALVAAVWIASWLSGRSGSRGSSALSVLVLACGLLALSAIACAPTQATSAPEAAGSELSGFRYRHEPSAKTAPDRPPAGGEWYDADSLDDRSLPAGHDLWYRLGLPRDEVTGATLLFRAYTGAFRLYLDGKPLYTASGGAASTSLRYHLVALPDGYGGKLLHVWVPRPRSAVLTSSVWRLVPRGALAAGLTGYVRDPLRREAPALIVGLLLTVVGMAAGALGLRHGRGDRLVLSFGAFALLYGLRILAETHLALVLGLPMRFSLYLEAWLTYLINVAAWSFFLELFGPGWRGSARLMLRVFVVLAIAGIGTDVALGRPMTLSALNSVLVVLGIVVVAGNAILTQARPWSREVKVVLAGATALALFAINSNLVGLGLLPWTGDFEALGFLVFAGCLGWIAARRFVRTEAELVALESELETARRIQLSILPRELPRVPGLEVEARYLPMSRVAGDLYDFMPIGERGERGLGVLVADVAGHGAPAALIAAMVKVAFSAQRPHAREPARLIGELNQILCANLKRDFVTALYLYFDLEQRRLTVCAAGHPGPLLLRGGGVRELEVRGVLLGRFADAAYRDVSVELLAGDRLVAYTDGVVEARSPEGELYGSERLERSVVECRGLAPAAFADRLIESARGFTQRPGQQALDDDLTLVVVDIGGP